MGKETGFLELDRQDRTYGPVDERLKNYKEFVVPLSAETLKGQASRCMNCGVPHCHTGCPVNNIIPDWNHLVYEDDFRNALQVLHSTNNFPEFTGRICPAPCEAACTLNLIDEPVTIKSIECAIVDKGWSEGWITPKIPETKTGKSVAVVGSGPAGLACAQQLARAGHSVTVFEKNDRVGGLMRYGIPDFKMEKHLINRRAAQMEAEGVTFRTSTEVGVNVSVSSLKENYDAIVFAGGAEDARKLQIPGAELPGVRLAMEFLTQQNKRNAGDEEVRAAPRGSLTATGKHVIVIGGGDTGSDCVGTSNRQGAASVTQLEIMPKPPEKEDKALTWPDWPLKLRTSSSHEEGVDRDWAVLTKRVVEENGDVAGLECVRVEWKDGRMQEVAGSEFTLKADLILKTDLKTDDVRNTRASGNLSFKNLSAMKMLTADEWSSRFKLEAHDKSLTRVRISQKTQINKPSFHQDDLELALESVSLETASRQNLKEGEVNIDTFILQSPNLVTARLKATLKEWGKNFEIEGQIEKLQLGSLWDHLPSTIKSDLENLKAGGTLDIDLKTKGRLPENKGSEAKPVTPTKPLWARLLVPANAGDKAPVEISAEIKLHNGFLNFSGLPENPEKKIHAEALNTKTRLTFKNGHADLSGNFSGKLEGLGKIDLNPEFEFHYVLDNLNTLRVKQHQLKLMNVEHSLQGQISGLKPFITGQRPVRANELLNRLDIKLANTNTIDISQVVNANPLFVGLETQGIIAAKIKFYQSAGKKLNVDGNVEFDQVNLRLPSVITLKNLSGTFPFSKTLLLDPKQMKEKSGGFFPAQKKFFTRLRDFSRYKNIIRADSLEVKGQILKDIGLDVVFKDNRLMAEKFIFDVLGGTVAGNLFLIQDRQGPVLKFSTEFAGIDSSKLLAVPVEKKIDARVDGNLQVELKIKTGSEGQPVSLDQLSVKIAITRIGTQTLDRLLLFLDPEESKPAIMDTRAKLKLATPHRVRIVLENGNLNVEAWLKSDLLGTFKAPELKRVPIAALKRFNTIHEHLQALKDLQQISNYLSARGLQFKDEKIVLHH